MPNRKISLVIVDDEPLVVRVATKVLTNAMPDNLDIHPFSEPKAAQRWIEQNMCDVLLSDIEMPGINGMELLRIAKQRNPWTQVLFMTAHSTWDHITDAIENGASDYLLKPLDHEELVTLVRHECTRQFRWRNVIMGSMKTALPI